MELSKIPDAIYIIACDNQEYKYISKPFVSLKGAMKYVDIIIEDTTLRQSLINRTVNTNDFRELRTVFNEVCRGWTLYTYTTNGKGKIEHITPQIQYEDIINQRK